VWFWGGADEKAYTETLLAGLSEADRPFVAMPPFLTIPQAAKCMQQAHCVVGLDSGFTHLSSALGRPTLGIYCDYDSAVAPMTAHSQGVEFVASLGGVGNPPSLESVLAVLRRWLP
jgi:heptosyltransferase-1